MSPDPSLLNQFPEGYDAVEKIESDAELALDWLVERAREAPDDFANLRGKRLEEIRE